MNRHQEQSALIGQNRAIMDKDDTSQLQGWMLAVADKRCKQSFANLFYWFSGKVQRMASRQVHNDALAAEIMQEAMTQIWRKAHLYHADKGAVTTWVYTIARNLCFDHLRKKQTQCEQNISDDLWPIHEEVVVESDVFTDHLFDKKLLQKLESLPEKQKQIVQGVFFQEFSQEQLARHLDIPLGTVKSRLRLALSRLKQEFGEQND
ncbi:sigma-70 family RNA polymerase sigma factor [Psychrosphaera sp. B3R10]|uniref:sigma-70 family RNA polymerase sigma factor n=1 Tax=unclassified Psychrosphaera TaxID=2641570 RepID=UPI001C0828EC|nr:MULTISPECIES: sigma-70 family RNA polymerase sigma factor [unclassified Psychrosphaera]MBU2882434.1 sigma-70 family RNA polymerase sigma factor [Psychrosphaera sp. I2R16]MBU2990255.1 sigma-70 family RNA polymerase sigma factor [Psychrosphaera sp. B3R10]